MRGIGSSDRLMQHAGQGDAFIFQPSKTPNALDHLRQAEESKAAAAAAEKAKRDKAIEQAYKYDTPEAIFMPFSQERDKKVGGFIDQRAKLMQEGVLPGDPRYQEWEKSKFELIQDVKKADDFKTMWLKAYGAKPSYTKENVYKSKLNDLVSDQKSISDVDPTNIDQVALSPETLDEVSLSKDFVSSIPEAVNQYVQTKSIMIGEDKGKYFDEVKEKSKFFEVGPNGQPKIDPVSGKPILKITPEMKKMLMESDARVPGFIESELKKPENEGKTEDDIIKEMLSPFAYARKESNPSGITKESKSGSDKKAELNYDIQLNKDRNVFVPERNEEGVIVGEGAVKTGWVPVEVSISGSKVKDVKMRFNKYWDVNGNPEENENITKHHDVTITSLTKLPVDKKGNMLIGSKEKIKNAGNLGGYKWFVTGQFDAGQEVMGKKVSKTKDAFIELDEVKGWLDAKNIDYKKIIEEAEKKELNQSLEIDTEDPAQILSE